MTLALAVAVTICFHTRAQNFVGTSVIPFDTRRTAVRSPDSLYVMEITPSGLDQLISESSNLVLLLYKPYCSGLEKGFARYSALFHYCLDRNIEVAFVAVSRNDLAAVRERYIHKYDLQKVHCYVVDRTISTNAYDAILARYSKSKKPRNLFHFVNGSMRRQMWSYKLKQSDVADFVKG